MGIGKEDHCEQLPIKIKDSMLLREFLYLLPADLTLGEFKDALFDVIFKGGEDDCNP